ncbi:SAR2788 family putative toxin [Bacillus cereus]|uniref:SAR2788 family putative toxin n=1 Tax=Bacillus cereus group TaxID=86661 RepID=UPI00207AAC17|nr:SAR2788 family putative toxin [Bacillus thuringiensis]MCU4991132.1 SAR2788 family putative toxin [Bacillus cereus]USL16388.1 SAR2788 family putative toxin [Bacillus thuringiensis]
MKKYFIFSIITALFITYVPTGFVYAAQENDSALKEIVNVTENTETSKIDAEVKVDVKEDLGIESSEQIEITENVVDNVDTFESILDTDQVQMESTLEYNIETSEMSAKAILNDENGNEIEKNFSILVTDVEGEDLKAIFVDQETGEQYSIDTQEITASALPLVPVLVAFIVKSGLKAAIKKYGPTAIRTLMKNSEPLAKAVASRLGYAETKFYSHGARVYYNKKGKPKYITRDKDGHIGGAFKGADTVKALANKKTRSGTYDLELRRIGA